MKDVEFDQKVELVIEKIANTIEDNDIHHEIDVDLNDNILTLITNGGTFVINKQRSTKEIWLSSPLSGPYHFALKEEKWISRNQTELLTLLTKELKIEFTH